MLLALVFISGFENLYLLDITASYYETLHVSSCGTKRKLTDENSTTLIMAQIIRSYI